MADIYNFPGEQPPKGGGGPEEDPRYPENIERTQGLSIIAFGFAFGFAFLLFFGLVEVFLPHGYSDTVIDFVYSIKPLIGIAFFVYGFICGVIIAAVYNTLVIRRLLISGIERGRD
jgi:nitrate reductase gamma subunit